MHHSLYIHIYTIYIFTCINRLNFLNQVNGVLIRQMHFHIFYLRYQLSFKDLGTVLNVPRLPLLCLTLLKYIWEKKGFMLKYYSSENLKRESTKKTKKDVYVKSF